VGSTRAIASEPGQGRLLTANILLHGGATDTGMVPGEMPVAMRANLLHAAIMGPPIVWLVISGCRGSSRPVVARDFDDWLSARQKETR
jgi:hypothetical protein